MKRMSLVNVSVAMLVLSSSVTLFAQEDRVAEKQKRLKKLQSSRRILKEEITEEDIARIVSRWTGIPVTRMLEEEAEKLSRMDEELKKRIVGQDEAVQKIADTVKRSRAGISVGRRAARSTNTWTNSPCAAASSSPPRKMAIS